MFQRLKARFKEYKYRSVPWLLLNWRKGTLKKVTSIENKSNDETEVYLSTLQKLFVQLNNSPPHYAHTPCEVMKKEFGISIHKKKSSIPDGGNGVFVKSGYAKTGSIVALYPGTVYYPFEPLLFQSFGNSYILQCVDGLMVDGKGCGLSSRIFRSCAARDRIGQYKFCDTSWMNDDQSLNPLSIGQYVNNASKQHSPNVMYKELDIPLSFPPDLFKFIPNVNFNAPDFSNAIDEESKRDIVVVRTVLLLAVRDINEGEELFSSYFTEVKS